MTERAEIERLLKKTGRTLEGLPKDYHIEIVSDVSDDFPGWYAKSKHILHQSDVIELLVAALRDALEKPLQKPLTLEEATGSEWPVWIEIEGWKRPQVCDVWISELVDGYAKAAFIGRTRSSHFAIEKYGKGWRCWATRPTDEERNAAPWEV